MKPDVVEIHLKKMVIVPEMIGTIVGVHNGKVFTQVEVKPEMIGHYLGEFSISSKQQKGQTPCDQQSSMPLQTRMQLGFSLFIPFLRQFPTNFTPVTQISIPCQSVEIILAAQCWKRGETNDNVIRLMKCANFVEIVNFEKCNFCV